MSICNHPLTRLALGLSPRPYLAITLADPNNGKSLKTNALIDTGADNCAFPADFALSLGHNLLAGRERAIGTGNGKTSAYIHTLQIKIDIDGFETGLVPIDFLPNLLTPLLGVKSFLAHFVLTVNYPENWFSLTSPIKSVQQSESVG